MEEKLAYIREMNELKEGDEEEENNNDRDENKKKSFDSDDLNWKTLRIDIDLKDSNELGIELAYASKIIEKLEVNDNELDKSISEQNEFQLRMSPKIKTTALNAYDKHSIENNSNDLETSNENKSNEINQYDEINPDSFNPNDELILVSDIDENGLAFGKLKIFDRLLKINEIDVQKLTAEEIKQIILQSRNTISFIISRHFGKSTDCLIRNKSSTKHLTKEENDDEIDEEIISTSMSLITSSSSHSNLPNSNKKANFYDSSFRFDRSDVVNRYKLNRPHEQKRRNSDEDTLDLISINKSSLNDLLLETGVYVSNIVRKNNAELSVGDRILSVNGHSLTNKTLYEIMDLVNHETNQFKLVVKKGAKSRPISSKRSVSRNRGFIVLSQSNISNSSVSVLNHTIRSSNNMKTSSNLIFNIKDQKEIRKQIELNNNAIKTAKPINQIDLVQQQKQCKKYYANKIASIEQKEQSLLDDNLNKYQELIRNFHSQSRKGNQMFLDIEVVEATEKMNSKSSLLKFHQTSPRVIDQLDKTFLSSEASIVSGLEATNPVVTSKRFRKSNPQTDTMKFNYRRSLQQHQDNLNLF